MIAFITVGELGVFGRSHFGAGKRLAQRAQRTQRFKGMEDDEIAGVVGVCALEGTG